MPKYEDLNYLKERIIHLGREPEIRAKKGEKILYGNIPDKEVVADNSPDSFNELLDDSLLNDILEENITDSKKNEKETDFKSKSEIDDIMSGFDFSSTQEKTENSDFSFDNISFDNTPDNTTNDNITDNLNIDQPNEDFSFDNLSGDFTDNFDNNEKQINNQDISEESILNDSQIDGLDQFMNIGNENILQSKTTSDSNLNKTGDELDDLLNINSGNDNLSFDNAEFSFNDNAETSQSGITSNFDLTNSDLNDLLNINQKSEIDNQYNSNLESFETENLENQFDSGSIDNSFQMDNAKEDNSFQLDDFAKTEGKNISSENDNFQSNLQDSFQNDFQENLQDNFQNNFQDNLEDSSVDNLQNNFQNDFQDNLQDSFLNNSQDNIFDKKSMDNLTDSSAIGTEASFVSDFSLADEIPSSNTNENDLSFDLSTLDNLDSLSEDISQDKVEEDIEEISDISSSDSFGENISDSNDNIDINSLSFGDSFENSFSGDSNQNFNQGGFEGGEEEEIVLTDEERKAVILTLSTFPKEAEIKIAKAIISDKIPDSKKMPLVRALINQESQYNIAKHYEKLTGDKSLQKLNFKKFTGEDFEKQQKSIFYTIEKKVLPFLSRIAAVALLVVLIFYFYFGILSPTLEASKYYKLGKQNIENLKFDEVEPYFEKAYSIQPRYNEIIAYARKYREYERIVEAERKYQMAAELKDDRKLDLEFADFYREIKKYEKSYSLYNYLIKKNSKDKDALNGLGRNFLDWSNEEKSKINDAEEQFLKVLDIDMKDFNAINNLILTYIQMDNKKRVIDSYKYFNRFYPKKADIDVFTKLASYLIDKNELNLTRDVLKKANELEPKKYMYPDIDYQNARYNRALNVRDEERKYLERAIKKIEYIKKSDIRKKYKGKEFIRLKAMIYNDLGENYFSQSTKNIKAEELFNKAIVSDPEYAKPYYNLGNFSYITKGNREEALFNYLEAEKKGFTNDIQDYNLGWLYYKNNQYYDSYLKINKLLSKQPDNDNLRFMVGTILYKLDQYDLSYSVLLETYEKFNTLYQSNKPLDMDVKDHRYIIEMLYKISNNLGSSLFMKYKQSRNITYLTFSHNYFAKAIEFYDYIAERNEALKEIQNTNIDVEDKNYLKRKYIKVLPHLNLKMSLYPGSTNEEKPIVYEEFDQFEFMNKLF